MQQEWLMEYDGSTIEFLVDDLPIMKVRYMPLEYSGFGYYTYGKQKLVVEGSSTMRKELCMTAME